MSKAELNIDASTTVTLVVVDKDDIIKEISLFCLIKGEKCVTHRDLFNRNFLKHLVSRVLGVN